jgi:hypothetical protein
VTHLLRATPADPLNQPDHRFPRSLLSWVADRARPFAPASRNGRLLLIGPAVVAALLLAILVYVSGCVGGDETPVTARVWLEASPYWLLGYLYNVAPSLAMAGLVSLASRRMVKGMLAAAVGTAVFTAFNLWALIPMFVDDSSTGVLLFLFLPLYTGTFVVIVGLVALLVHKLRNRNNRAASAERRRQP